MKKRKKERGDEDGIFKIGIFLFLFKKGGEIGDGEGKVFNLLFLTLASVCSAKMWLQNTLDSHSQPKCTKI